jgi:hypothetical protein
LADVEANARRRSRGERASHIYPIALEAVQRIDALFDIERAINGKNPSERLALRQDLSAPLVDGLHAWLTAQMAKLSRNHDLAKAINLRCAAGMPSPASLMTDEFASRTTRRNGLCAACPWAGRHGCFAGQIVVGSGPLCSTR